MISSIVDSPASVESDYVGFCPWFERRHATFGNIVPSSIGGAWSACSIAALSCTCLKHSYLLKIVRE